jgi:SsrA-binding protein
MKGLTIIPLKLYFKKRKAKLEIAICRGKNLHDKRQDLIKKDDAKKAAE